MKRISFRLLKTRNVLFFSLLTAVLLLFSACGQGAESASTEVTIPPTTEGTEPMVTFPVVSPEDVTFPQKVLSIGGPGFHVYNILLLGQDRGSERPHEGERTYADVILLCTFNTEHKQLKLTSFQRDLYVDIPGHGPDKLSYAYQYGGIELMAQTMKKNFGVLVDGSVEVDFDQFPKVVDALGGATIEITQEEAEEINHKNPQGNLSAGYRKLDGRQALTYCRIRRLDSDYIRTRRQQKFMEAMLQQVKSLTLTKALSVAAAVVPIVESDLSFGELLDMIRELFPLAREFMLFHQQVPFPGTYEECIIDEKWVFKIDFELNSKYLYDTLCLGKDYPK